VSEIVIQNRRKKNLTDTKGTWYFMGMLGSEIYEDADKVVIAFSGGKDSLALVLDCLESGVARDKIELWHHCVLGLWTHGGPASPQSLRDPIRVRHVRTRQG